jgi:hypothetical protein
MSGIIHQESSCALSVPHKKQECRQPCSEGLHLPTVTAIGEDVFAGGMNVEQSVYDQMIMVGRAK